MSSMSYDVRELAVSPRPVAGVHALVPRGRVAQEFGRYLDQVYAAARAGAVHLDGQDIFIYRAATVEDPAQLRTEIYYLLQPSGAEARP